MKDVLRWSGLATLAAAETGIPANVLLALIEVESGGRPGLTSSANAQGITQFIPGTAREYNVDVSPGQERSQVFGAARYLRDLGYQQDPRKALASYNAGPGNYRAGLGYADKVMGASGKYRGLRAEPDLDAATLPAIGTTGAATVGTRDEGGLINDDRRRQLLSGVLFLGLLALGVTLAGIGTARATGARSALGSLATATPVGRAAKAVT